MRFCLTFFHFPGTTYISCLLIVLGPVEPSSLGVILPHEHFLVDFRQAVVKPERDLELVMENLGVIRRFPYVVKCVHDWITDSVVSIAVLETWVISVSR